MTDDTGSEWGPPTGSTPDPQSADPQPAHSSLPPPPPASPPAPPVSPLAPPTAAPVDVASTGPVMAEPKRSWAGRIVALVAAVALVGGGGYLVLNAGSADGGADTPEGALDGVLAALSSEDLLGASAFVEPAERETLVDAGFDVFEELTRLEVLDDSLDLSSVDGIDLDFDGVEIDAVEVGPGLAHLFVSGGSLATSVDGLALPFGPLVTDRIDEGDLAFTDAAVQTLPASTTPIVAVERDGRWYLSLWYTVAENARLSMDASLPSSSTRLAAIGGDSPEAAIENFVGALEELDLAAMIGTLDPEEASALYDYAPLFLGDAQSGVDDLLQELRVDGWFWEVTDLGLRADTDGDRAVVHIEGIAGRAENQEISVDFALDDEGYSMSMESPELSFDMESDGDCVVITADEGYGPETEEVCAGDMGSGLGAFGGIGGMATGGLDSFPTTEEVGIVVHRVDGRWYLSPTRTMTEAVLTGMRAIDADEMAETIDSFIEGFSEGLAGSFGALEQFEEFDDMGEFDLPLDTTTTAPFTEFSPTTDDNAGLLVEGPEYVFVYDLADDYRDDVWALWLTEAEPFDFGSGVIGQGFFEDSSYFDMIVMEDLPFASDKELAGWLGGEVVTSDEFTYVVSSNSWGEQLLSARFGSGIAVVATYDVDGSAPLELLRAQVGG